MSNPLRSPADAVVAIPEQFPRRLSPTTPSADQQTATGAPGACRMCRLSGSNSTDTRCWCSGGSAVLLLKLGYRDAVAIRHAPSASAWLDIDSTRTAVTFAIAISPRGVPGPGLWTTCETARCTAACTRPYMALHRCGGAFRHMRPAMLHGNGAAKAGRKFLIVHSQPQGWRPAVPARRHWPDDGGHGARACGRLAPQVATRGAGPRACDRHWP